MSITGEKFDKADGKDKTRLTVFIVAGLIAIVLIAGLVVYLKTRPEPQPISVLDQKLEEGLSADSSEFEKYRDLIKLDEPEADYASSVASGIQMRLVTTARNFTGRTIIGLEMRGSVTDLDGKLLKERTMVVIPSNVVEELQSSETARVPIPIAGFQGEDAARIESGQAKIKMEVTAVRFK